MKLFNHTVCSSMNVNLLYNYINYFELIIILFHLQMMPTISLTALSHRRQKQGGTRGTVLPLKLT